MNAIANWIALSSGPSEATKITGVTWAEGEGPSAVPGALLDLLGSLGKLAGNVADLIGLIA